MKKILILGFYELKSHMLAIRDALIKYNYDVYDYPLFRYAYDKYDKLENYHEHLDEYIKKVKPDVILWWFCDVPIKIFEYIKKKNPKVVYVGFNGDDPLNFNASLIHKFKIFDIILTTCEENLVKYALNCNAKDVLFLPHSYDEKYFYPLEDKPDELACDISMICQHMFPQEHYDKQIIYRKDLFDNISKYCKETGRTFHLYGTPMLSSLYPEHYKGELNYIDENRLFNYSKINLVTHPICVYKNSITDFDFKVLGSGGLMVSDKCLGLEQLFGDGCVFMDKDNYMEQIDNILNNYDNYRETRKKGQELSKNYTWEVWVDKLNISLRKIDFDGEFYKDLYDIDTNDPWEHWLSVRKEAHYYTAKFTIPTFFNCEQYAEDKELDIKKRHKVYLHWVNNDQPEMYIMQSQKKKSGGFEIDYDKIGTSMEGIYDFYYIFNKISRGNVEEGLMKLHKKAHDNPRVDINYILEMYTETVE